MGGAEHAVLHLLYARFWHKVLYDLGLVTTKEPFRKLVYGCRANNELLPFADETFTAYLAPLSAMLVSNPLLQFREAYRVLQKGCTATFTIWGRREASLMIGLLEDVILRHAPAQMQEEEAAASSHFDLSSGKRFPVEETLRQMGFSQVKMWYQPQNVLFRTGEEYVAFWESKFKRLCAKAGFDEGKTAEVRKECVTEFDELSGASTSALRTFEVQVILCFKD